MYFCNLNSYTTWMVPKLTSQDYVYNTWAKVSLGACQKQKQILSGRTKLQL